MSLNSLYLFKNVKITPDYSVVHDLDPQDWRDFLLGQGDFDHSAADRVWNTVGKLNYYRVPDVIRVEGNFDELREATYGFLEDGMWNDQQPAKTSFKQMFFWVTDVRLITQRANDITVGAQTVFRDVVELHVEVDTWSTYGIGAFELYDSFVERRHMNRWRGVTQAGVTTYTPIYYPNAAQGIEGAYQKEDSQDLTAPVTFSGYNDTFDPRFIIVFTLEKSGLAKIYIGIDVETRHNFVPVYELYNTQTYFGLQQILDGSFFTAAGITQENVQSITVVPYLAGLKDCLRLGMAGYVF